MSFGPDGFLYIGMGDGGSGNDPDARAQNPSELLGKMLRIDVNVSDAHPTGFDIPPDNPFRAGPAPEIWAFGLRNPWRFSFDDPGLGGTGAMVIGDVGQSAREEIDYEPAGRGGRNYGWRNREGTLENVTTLPPAFLPLTNPIFEYDRTVGRSITGGYVYRGTALGAAYRGRYFYADFITGRVWSLALTIHPGTAEATASDVREHTADLGGAPLVASLSSWGVDAAGELYLVNYSAGTILRIRPESEPEALLRIEVPAYGARLREPFVLTGWALDPDGASGSGIDQLQVWAVPFAGGSAISVGTPGSGISRPDVAAVYGPRGQNAGFGIIASRIPPGRYYLVAFGRVIASGNFGALDYVDVTIEGGGLVGIESPAANATIARPFVATGYALDGAATTGTGVSGLLAYAVPVDGGSPISLGVTYGISRPDIAAAVGAQFQNSGFRVTVSTSLPPGTYDLAVISRSTVTGTYSAAHVIRVTVQ
jgi:hypothetical protein